MGKASGALARSEAWNRWMAKHHGVVTVREAERLGMTYRQLKYMADKGDLIRIVRGAYRSALHPQSELQVMTAICLLHPSAAIGFTTAGRLLGFRGMTDPRVHVVVPAEHQITLRGIEVHRTRRLELVDVTGRRPDGIRLTSPPRTLVDSASILGVAATESAIEQALADRRVTLHRLISTAIRLHHAQRPGSTTFLHVIESRPRWRKAARSELERHVRATIEAAGLPRPEVNMRYQLAHGEWIEIDLAYPDWKVAVEVDHPFWHDGAAEAAKDKRRDRKLSIEGWVTIRFPEQEISNNLDELVQDLGLILVDRGMSPTPHVRVPTNT